MYTNINNRILFLESEQDALRKIFDNPVKYSTHFNNNDWEIRSLKRKLMKG